jgi:hypothetical protein
MYRWLGSRILWGVLLVVAGLIFLLESLNILILGSLFWSLLFFLGGIFFLSMFVSDRSSWWWLIPGFTLLGIGGLILLSWAAPGLAETLGGALVLGGIGLSFLVVYLVNRDSWWAIIPAGVMLTLVAVTLFSSRISGAGVGGILFLGLGLTFALVATIPTREGRMTWAWIPAGILTLIGLFILAAAEALIGYLWPIALIILGGFFLLRAFLPRLQ